MADQSIGKDGNKKEIRQPVSMPTEGVAGFTSAWRSQLPVLDSKKCNGCLLCWIYCPEALITREDRSIDLRYCKGCGVCARECPVNAIEMAREGEQNR